MGLDSSWQRRPLHSFMSCQLHSSASPTEANCAQVNCANSMHGAECEQIYQK